MFTHSRTSSCRISDGARKDRYPAENAERKDGKGDFKINVKDSSIMTHCSVLMSSSDYFKTMLSGGFSEKNANDVDFSELFDEIEDLNIVIDYMYTGCIELSEQNIEPILNTACHFLLTDLQVACSSFLKINISPQTSLPILSLAERYSLKYVQDICVEVIRTWFPFSLYHSSEAVQIPPHCLNVLINENVLSVLPENKTKAFLQRWYENFQSTKCGVQSFPQELRNILQRESIFHCCQPQTTISKALGLVNNKAEDTLFAVFTGSAPTDTSCCVEVHAFALKMNQWKVLLRQTFTKKAKEDIPSLLGITEKTAYFLLHKNVFEDSSSGFIEVEECIIAVDMKSNVASAITLPGSVGKYDGPYYGGGPHYFMWNGELFGLFWEMEGIPFSQRTWSLFRCRESNWEKVCEFCCSYQNTEFLMKAVGDTVYIWWKEYSICGSALAWMDYSFASLKRSPERDEFEVKELKSPRACDHESGDYFDAELSTLCSIVLDDQSHNLKFIHMLDSGDFTENEEDDWHAEHEYQVFTYDTTSGNWTEGDICKVFYPDIEYTIEEPRKMIYKTKLPIRPPVKRIVFHAKPKKRLTSNSDRQSESDGELEDYDLHTIKRCGPELCIGALYYLKTTSPYNTTLWKLNTADKQWDVIGHLPHSLDRYPAFQTGELRTEFLMSMPDSEFKDFSSDIGESAFATTECEEAAKGLVIEFSEGLLTQEIYDKRFEEFWHAKQ